jgi:outer membrane protein assembly factor BamB
LEKIGRVIVLYLGLLILVLAQSAYADEWSMFMHDVSHTGVAEETVEPPLILVWKYKTDGSIYSTPAVSGGIVYITSDDSFVYALDADTGSLKWKYETDGSIFSSPAISGGMVFISSADSIAYALDAIIGNLKWKYKMYTSYSDFIRTLPYLKWKPKAAPTFGSSPAVSDGILYIGGDDYIYALDTVTGNLKWRYNTSLLVRSSPAVSEGVVFIGNWWNPVYALDTSTGNLKWQYEAGSITSSPAVSGGVVFISSWDEHLYALNASTGNVKWKFKTNNSLYSSPAVSGDVVYLNALDGYVYALNASTGSLKWKFKTGGFDSSSSPAVSGDVVFTVVDKYLYTIDSRTGNLNWKYETGNTIGPAVSGGMVYVGSNDGNLYAFASQNRSITSSKPLEINTIPWNVIFPVVFVIVFILFFLLRRTHTSKKEKSMDKQDIGHDKIYGTKKDFLGKMKGFFLAPSKTFGTTKRDSLYETIEYFIGIAVLYFVISALFYGFVIFLFLSGFSSELSGIFYGLFIIAVMVYTILWVIISAPITHIGVYILGGRKGFIQTLKAVIYASTILLLLGWWLPTIFFGWIWASVVEIIGIRQLQDLSTTRAIVASIMPRIIMLCIIFLRLFNFFW